MKSLIDKLAGIAVIAAAIASMRRRQPVPAAAAVVRPRSARRGGQQAPSGDPTLKGLVLGVREAIGEDEVGTLAAAMTYYSFLALFPALIAVVSIYGLVASPDVVAEQVNELTALLPGQSAAELIETQLTDIVTSSRGGLGVGLVVSLLGVLWAVSSGVSALIKGINLAFNETETRSFVKIRLLALGLTVGLLVFVLVSVFIITGLPPFLRSLGWGAGPIAWAAAGRWLLLVLGAVAGLTIFYRLAPNRTYDAKRWLSIGALVAAGLWLVASILLNVYVTNFGSYNETYGALAGVIVLMLWLYVSSFIVLLGAEIDAELEKRR